MFKHICIILSATLLFVLLSCNKETNDRRLRYVGEYKGTCEWYKAGHPELCDTGSGKSELSFTVKLGKTDSTLRIYDNEYCPVKGGGYKLCGSNGEAVLFGNQYRTISGYSGTVCQSRNECIASKVE